MKLPAPTLLTLNRHAVDDRRDLARAALRNHVIRMSGGRDPFAADPSLTLETALQRLERAA